MLQVRSEAFEKNLTVAGPTTRIRQLNNQTMPSCPSGGAPDVVPDGLYQRHDGGGMKLPNFSAECGFTL